MADVYSGVTNALPGVVALPQAIRDLYSTDILYTANGIMKFADFAVKKTELMRDAGQTVIFTKYDSLVRGGVLVEANDLETKNMSASQIPISITEYGNAVGLREKLLQVAFNDQMMKAAKLLGRDYAVVTDLMLRDVILGAGGTTLYGGGKASRILMDVNTDFFDVEIVRQAIEELQTVNAPKFNGDYYIAFIHPHQAAYLKRDPDWVAANNYAQTRRLFNGEIGRWEDTVFISTTHMNNGAVGATDPAYEFGLATGAQGGGLPGGPVYKAAIFADNAFAFAEGLPVELRDNGIQDFGRRHGLAWYSIMGSGLIDANYVVNIETT